MGRNSPPEKGDYEPDWTEEELEEKLAALRARGGNKPARLDANLRKHGIELDYSPQLEGSDDEVGAQNSRAADLARSLIESGEWEELKQLTKVQIIMDPQSAKEWRSIGKMAAKARRNQRHPVVKGFLFLRDVIGWVIVIGIGIFLALIVAFLISLFHH